MKRNRFMTATVGLCAGFAVALGVGSPALADPEDPTTVALAGSDTTQDVMNGFAQDVAGEPFAGSWNATPVHTDITPKSSGCTNITRPNGSGEGVTALRYFLSGTDLVGDADSVSVGIGPHAGTEGARCFDAARSSSGPGANQSNTGLLRYVPFALDAVALATGGSTTVTGADNLTLTNLIDLYRDCETVNGLNPNTGGNIHLYIPQPGSGTRSFWLATMGIGAVPACVHDTSLIDNTTLVQEHDGTVLAADAKGVAPFSIAQWIAQSDATLVGSGKIVDRRHGAVLRNLNSQVPFNVVSGVKVMNRSFPITREVYNVIPQSVVDDPDLFPALRSMFVGSDSELCAAPGNILTYGFALLDETTDHTCGDVIDDNLRAFAEGTF